MLGNHSGVILPLFVPGGSSVTMVHYKLSYPAAVLFHVAVAVAGIMAEAIDSSKQSRINDVLVILFIIY
jgi:hypothetical protein